VPLVSGSYTLDHAEEAFALASGRKVAIKVPALVMKEVENVEAVPAGKPPITPIRLATA
jgi:hypothetical protein